MELNEMLKPCPFCGGPGDLLYAREDCEGWFIEARVICPKCRFEIVGSYRQTTRGWASEADFNNSAKTAVERWNRRTNHERGGWINKEALLKQIYIDADGSPGLYCDTWKFIDTIENMPAIKTKQIKYFDDDEKVWKIGEAIVDETDQD